MQRSEEIERYFDFGKKLILKAGKLLQSSAGSEKNVMAKGDKGDLVTNKDFEIEKILISGLSSEFPDHKFIAEESCEEGVLPPLTDSPTWIIDPIDGTVNFAHSFPQYCISIGLAINRIIEVGLIYNPCNDELYTAKRGQGAYLNGNRLKASGVTELSRALIIIEPGVLRVLKTHTDILKHRIEALSTFAGGIRNAGSAALALAYVARGVIDVFHFDGLKPWDVAAGYLMVEEAGGTIIDTKGGPLDLMNPMIIAASTLALAQEVSELIVKTDLETKRARLKKSKH